MLLFPIFECKALSLKVSHRFSNWSNLVHQEVSWLRV